MTPVTIKQVAQTVTIRGRDNPVVSSVVVASAGAPGAPGAVGPAGPKGDTGPAGPAGALPPIISGGFF